MSLILEEGDLNENNWTGVAEEAGEMMDGETNWSRRPQETTETSGSKEVPVETVGVTEVTLKSDNSCSVEIIDEDLRGKVNMEMNRVFFQSVKGNSEETFGQENNGGSTWTQISGEAPGGLEEMQGKITS